MSFTEEKIRDYEETIKKIRTRNEASRTSGFHKLEDLEETYQPMIEATKEQTKVLRDELQNLERVEVHPGMNALDFYLHQYAGKIDPYFGIK